MHSWSSGDLAEGIQKKYTASSKEARRLVVGEEAKSYS